MITLQAAPATAAVAPPLRPSPVRALAPAGASPDAAFPVPRCGRHGVPVSRRRPPRGSGFAMTAATGSSPRSTTRETAAGRVEPRWAGFRNDWRIRSHDWPAWPVHGRTARLAPPAPPRPLTIADAPRPARHTCRPRSHVQATARSLRQDLLDPGDRLVDRLLGADALGGNAVDRLWPDFSCTRVVCRQSPDGGVVVGHRS